MRVRRWDKQTLLTSCDVQAGTVAVLYVCVCVCVCVRVWVCVGVIVLVP